MNTPLAAPRLLLSVESLRGAARVSRHRMIEVEARYLEPESLAVTLSKALDAGAAGILAGPTPGLRAALAELDRVVPIHAVLPDVPPLSRVDLEPGLALRTGRGAPRRSLVTRVRVGLATMAHAAPLRRGDLAARLPAVLEAEAAALPPRSLAGVVLASGVADLALAGGNRTLFERTLSFIRSRFRVPAGIETCNPGLLLARLREWELQPDYVIGPFNPGGLGMKPTPEAVIAAVAAGTVPFLARELRAGGMGTLEEGARWARANGAWGLVPDLAELDDVAGELRRLVAAAGAALPAPV